MMRTRFLRCSSSATSLLRLRALDLTPPFCFRFTFGLGACVLQIDLSARLYARGRKHQLEA
jgi:hypothetical protein